MTSKSNKMAAVLSPQTASTSPSPTTLPPPRSMSPGGPPLPPLVTTPPMKPSATQRQPSYAAKRLSTFSNSSMQSRSRPQSTVFPLFHSSLSYSLVRDFAYPHFHPLHYGPPPETASSISTPASEHNRRLSDPPAPSWESSRTAWSATPWDATGSDEQLPTTSFADRPERDRDGPPWSEDEDLQSPVVTSSRHRKQKSNMVSFDQSRGRTREIENQRRGSYTGTNGDGSTTYYVSEINEAANGPGGEYITYPPSGNATDSSQPGLGPPSERTRRDSHFAATLPNRSYYSPSDPTVAHPYGADHPFSDDVSPSSASSEDSPTGPWEHDGYDADADSSRYSRDYQFTIASPDEEMHGKAVALFDFERENDNELPLFEGQIILVSYRHGEGWLVAQDPKTGESGLVPEEYVRLLRDIEGGWNGLMNGVEQQLQAQPAGQQVQPQQLGVDIPTEEVGSPMEEARTPTQASHESDCNNVATPVSAAGFPASQVRNTSPTNSSKSGSNSRSNSGASGGSGEKPRTGSAAGDRKEGDYYVPVVSTFSTSREDLEPWPHREQLLGSQASTPIAGQPGSGMWERRGSRDERSKEKDAA